MSEIRYITGLYDLWDTLRRDHPKLLIDNCASGGRRIDVEMLRRSLALWRSDKCWDATATQAMTYGLSSWVPLTGVGSDNVDVYACRSGLGSHYAIAANWLSSDPGYWRQARERVAEQNTVKHLFQGDVYPLTPYSLAPTAWIAWQFDRPDLGEGLVQAFRRPNSPEAAATFRMLGLKATAEYLVSNLDEQPPRRMTGWELMERGLTITLTGKPGAALFTCKTEVR